MRTARHTRCTRMARTHGTHVRSSALAFAVQFSSGGSQFYAGERRCQRRGQARARLTAGRRPRLPGVHSWRHSAALRPRATRAAHALAPVRRSSRAPQQSCLGSERRHPE